MAEQHNQFELLRQRRFAPLFWTQFLGAANDNVFKFSFTLFATYHAAQWGVGDPNIGGDWSHVGFASCLSREGTIAIDARLRYALMSSCPLPATGYMSVEPLDRALLRDMGYPVAPDLLRDGFEDPPVP